MTSHINREEGWILGVSLGFPRVLRLEKADSPSEYCDVLLPSGSVYVQRSLYLVPFVPDS